MNTKNEKPNSRSGPAWISKNSKKLERLLSKHYRKDQLLVFYRKKPTLKDEEIIKESFRKSGFKTEEIKIMSCGNCDIPVQLWSAKDIDTLISRDSIRAGSGPRTTTVGESYSLNFLNNIPVGSQRELETRLKQGVDPRNGRPQKKKDEIIVAVLDTGADTRLLDPQYIWQETADSKTEKCYSNVHSGWNFINDTANFEDDNPARHGTMVSQYIINEFKASKQNSVKIMPLKTHDKNGTADLFSIICAINFAIAKGANIINASWGFYYYFDVPVPYLKTLITGILRKKGILFITAAGNKIPADDMLAKQIYQDEYGIVLTEEQLRDLLVHNFYPAQLSTVTNSILVVTTTDGRTVSPNQNYSNKIVELGVIGDPKSPTAMQFKVPFDSAADLFISGSSFASAIASGIIGANCPKGLYVPNIQKKEFLLCLQGMASSDGTGNILVNHPVLAKKYIKNGSCLK